MRARRNPVEGETYSKDQAEMLAKELRRSHHTGVKIVKRGRHSRYPYTEGSPSKPGRKSSQDPIYIVTSRGQLTRNSGRRKKMTKAQKRANASKGSKRRRVAAALKKFLKAQNPAAKFAGAKIRRNKGSITIIPIKLRRTSR